MVINGEKVKQLEEFKRNKSWVEDKVVAIMRDRVAGAIERPKGWWLWRKCPHCGAKLGHVLFTARVTYGEDSSYSVAYWDCPNCEYEWGSINGW